MARDSVSPSRPRIRCSGPISMFSASRASRWAVTTAVRARGVNRAKPSLGSIAGGVGLGDEALLGGLFGDAHAGADIGP